jgi:hypothetical protein
MIRHGRGVGHKSHDCFAVPGCPACHERFKRSILGPEGYHAAWVEAMERWILYLWVSEKIRIADINQRPKETSMEAPMCKICDHRHYVRDPHTFPANAPAEKRSNKAATTNGADTNCRTLRADPRTSKGVPGTEGRGMNGQREVSRQGIVRPTNTEAKPAAKAQTRTTAEKVTPGKRKTAPKANKRKGKKKC